MKRSTKEAIMAVAFMVLLMANFLLALLLLG